MQLIVCSLQMEINFLSVIITGFNSLCQKLRTTYFLYLTEFFKTSVYNKDC